MEIAFVCYPVQDMARARRFYEEILGLAPTSELGGQWQEYDLGTNTFAIVQGGDEIPEFWKGKGLGIAFEVDDLDAELARLREAAVNILMEPFESPVCRAFVIEDTEGNTVTLHKRKA